MQDKQDMIVVIGSGPAAVAATHALVEAGKSVTILDAGKTLEADHELVRAKMAGQKTEDWSEEDIQTMVGRRGTHEETIHTKLSYGSSFATDIDEEHAGIHWERRKGFNFSHARGGLSNIWGSALLPYRQEDIGDWPVGVSDLEEHYRSVMKFVPGTFVDDDLESLLPARAINPQELHLSRQGRFLFERMDAARQSLRNNGVVHGHSRVAVRTDGSGRSQPCVYCGLCLSGCPYRLIYSSSLTLEALLSSDRLRYIPDSVVERIEKTGSGLRVLGHRASDNSRFSYEAGRVMLAAGVLPTAKIALESLGVYNSPIRLLDSQYFIIPMVQLRKAGNIAQEHLHTLSQAFVEIDDPAISQHLIHTQIYGYSRFLQSELEKTFLKWPLKIGLFNEEFLGRLIIAQGFLHSRDSGFLELVLKNHSEGKGGLHISHRPRLATKAKALAVALKFLWNSPSLGAVPIIPGIKIPRPGSGYHSGGTFPMRKGPGALETDILGRFPEFDRLHLIDSSIFPSIPATSITLSVMANAHRIASTVAGGL